MTRDELRHVVCRACRARGVGVTTPDVWIEMHAKVDVPTIGITVRVPREQLDRAGIHEKTKLGWLENAIKVGLDIDGPVGFNFSVLCFEVP